MNRALQQQTSGKAEQKPRESRWLRPDVVGALVLGVVVMIDLLALRPPAGGVLASPAVPYVVVLVIGAVTALVARAWPLPWLGGGQPPKRAAPSVLVSKRPPWWDRFALSPLGMVGFIALMLFLDRAAQFVVSRLQRGATACPIWAPLVAVAYLLVPVLTRVSMEEDDPAQQARRPLTRDLWLAAQTLILWAVTALVAMWVLDWVGPWLSRLSPIVWDGLIIALAVLALAGFITVTRRLVGPFFPVDAALRRGDYNTALELLEKPSGLLTGPVRRYLQGTVLFWQGRLQEAEEYLYQALYEGQDDALFNQGAALDRLGYVLLEQGRHEEATQAFSTSIELDPDRGHPYSGQGEVFLHRSEQPERALKLVRWGLQHRRGTLLSRLLGRREVGAMWANEAWAHALMGHYPQADEALYQAFKEGDPWFKPGLAATHYRAALTLLLRERRGDAAEHFAQAQQVDPNGLYGKLAAQALTEIEPWAGKA